jgi:hypothetical protein
MADASVRARPASSRRRLGARLRAHSVNSLLAAAAAGCLGIDAYVHVTTASSYASNGGVILNEGNLFTAEAAVAAAAALFLLVSPRTVGWLLSLAVAVTALAAVMVSTYIDVGAIGPVPDLYEPTWRVPGKVPATVAEIVATAVSLAALLLARRARSRPQGDSLQ